MICDYLITLKVSVDIDSGNITKKEILAEEEAPKPLVTLKGSLLEFNNLAIKLLNLNTGDGIYIMYENGEPIIGSSASFNLQGGKKLTSRGTVPYRGKGKELLENLGNVFILNFTETPGIFKLKSYTNNFNFNLNNIKLQKIWHLILDLSQQLKLSLLIVLCLNLGVFIP